MWTWGGGGAPSYEPEAFTQCCDVITSLQIWARWRPSIAEVLPPKLLKLNSHQDAMVIVRSCSGTIRLPACSTVSFISVSMLRLGSTVS